MPPEKAQQKPAKAKSADASSKKMANDSPGNEDDFKKNSGASASMAIQAGQKAWEFRQAANAAGDPDAREELLAKAINKEIEAESFGKAAKYTRSGEFQGLAAGVGLGVKPGALLGKLTGSLVGGLVSTATGLVGGGIGTVYGAMHGPFWDLGQMASQGVRSIVGDFPNWKSTPAQKKALEKMVAQTKETQAPTQEELAEMEKDAPDDMPQSWFQSAKDTVNWRPSVPSMPSIPSMPSGAALGLGGLGASISSLGGKGQDQQQNPSQPNQGIQRQSQQNSQSRNQRPAPSSKQPSKQGGQIPKEAPVPKAAPKFNETRSQAASISKQGSKSQTAQKQKEAPSETKPSPAKGAPKQQATPESKANTSTPKAAPPKEAAKPQASTKRSIPGEAKRTSSNDNKENKNAATPNGERKKPRKLGTKSSNAQPSEPPAPKRAPRKLQSRKAAA